MLQGSKAMDSGTLVLHAESDHIKVLPCTAAVFRDIIFSTMLNQNQLSDMTAQQSSSLSACKIKQNAASGWHIGK